MTNDSGYRPDIAGLRAVAVLPVLFYHFHVWPFSGGFVGVDVFFVISGYLITQKIWTSLVRGEFSLAGFYDARFRRILPAALAMIAVVLVVGAWVLLPRDLAALGRSAAFAAFGFSNFHFMNATGGYFDQAADLMPLLHTWSLAVEEQFYLFWPLALLALFRLSRGSVNVVVGAIVVIIVASLALSVVIVDRGDRNVAFFMLHTRAWELALGALIVFMPAIASRRLGELLGVAGLALVLASVFMLTHESSFPGWNAVPPCLGAALLIWPRAQGSVVGSLLSLRPMQFFGEISYSLYLWHWPLLVLYRQYGVGDLPDTGVKIVLIVLSVVLATLSLHLIENPIRRRRRPHWVTIRAGLAAATVVAVGGYAYLAYDGLPWRLPEQARFYADFLHKGPERDGPVCFLSSASDRRQQSYDWDECLKLSSDRPNVLVIGDSHADHFVKALRSTHPEVNFVQATSSGCQPILRPTGAKRCVALIREMFSTRIPALDLDAVIISARWNAKGIRSIRKTVDRMEGEAPRIIVFGPTIEYRHDVPTLLTRGAMSGRDLLSASRRYGDSSKRQDEIAGNLAGSNVRFVSVLDAICPEAGESCRALTPEGVPMQSDHAHLTYEGARYVLQHVDLGLRDAIAHAN